MNVLVYAGPEVLPQSLSRSLSLLQSVLRPNYAVQTITPQSLATHPWTSSCALLVFPACTHLALPSLPLRSAVREYVERGGALLALAARLTKQTHIPTDDTLYFYDKYAGSNYTLASTKSTDELVEGPVNLAQGKAIERLLHYPSPVLEDSVRAEDRIVLGTFDGGRIADAILHISGGKVAVFAQSLETTAPASTLIESETRALALPALTQLGLSIPDEAAAAEKNGRVPRAPLPQFLVGNPAVPGVVGQVMSALESVLASSSEGEGGRIIKDMHDSFLFHAHTPEHTALLLREGRSREEEEVERAVRHIVVCDTPPTSEETPLFDLHAFFDALNAARTASGTIPTPWAMGDALLYGEAVTSTQTLLDKCASALSLLLTAQSESQTLTGRPVPSLGTQPCSRPSRHRCSRSLPSS
jgi:biotin---protein ligase